MRMNLYAVRLYSHERNQTLRLLITAIDEPGATQLALDGQGHGWRVEGVARICSTHDPVYQELA